MTSPQLRHYHRKSQDPEFRARKALEQAARRANETEEERAVRLAYHKEWRRTRSAAQRARDTASMKRASEARRQRIDDLKRRPCMDCAIQYAPHIMQFDHRPGEEKLCDVSQMTSRRWELVEAEIAKCDVVCANCHADRTWKRRNA